MAHDRARARYALACLATLAAGLASRALPGVIPAFLGKYPGDVLWALMVYFGVAFILPRASIGRVAACALALSYGIEFLKLWQAPWLVHLRHTTLGHLVFGHAFSWQNLAAYAIGVGIGIAIEAASVTAPSP